jgi:transposase-like protein
MDTSERAVVKRGLPRRRRSVAERRRIAKETLEPGASVARVAQRHTVNANQAFNWRRLYRKGLPVEKNAGGMSLLPVTLSNVSVQGTCEYQTNWEFHRITVEEDGEFSSFCDMQPLSVGRRFNTGAW